VRLGDRQVELAPKEFELLRTLIADPTRVLTKVNFETRPAEGKGSERFRGSGRDW
jgi:DNA-binding response OmpR family regulator